MQIMVHIVCILGKIFLINKGEVMLVGCMFVGIGIGFLVNQMTAGTMIGMGVGFILQKVFNKD